LVDIGPPSTASGEPATAADNAEQSGLDELLFVLNYMVSQDAQLGRQLIQADDYLGIEGSPALMVTKGRAET